jgi:outer membrane protein assembly factor BamB
MGWTGQPAVWERPDGITELIFGAYDSAVHFVDAATGEDLRAEFQTGDLIKGSVTVDPDGYPLLYFGSRDNKYRILGLDGGDPVELWSMDATDVSGTWNDDWDSNGAVVDDILYVGGENSWFFAVELNRGYDADGKVTIDPQILVEMPGYDSELVDTAGGNVSIENSPVVYDQRVYFANSAGRIIGIDVSRVREGEAPIVFDYWAGGDIDASLVADAEGMLYAAVNVKPDQVGPGYRTQANIDRTRDVGQLLKLDPYTDGDARIWGVDLTAGSEQSGTWSTPAVYQGVVYNNTMQGSLIAVDAVNGEILWSDEVGWHSWSSPVVVEGMLVTATCLGDVRGYSLADPRAPVLSWSVSLGETCLEATPAVWDGVIYIGSRDGYLRALG